MYCKPWSMCNTSDEFTRATSVRALVEDATEVRFARHLQYLAKLVGGDKYRVVETGSVMRRSLRDTIEAADKSLITVEPAVGGEWVARAMMILSMSSSGRRSSSTGIFLDSVPIAGVSSTTVFEEQWWTELSASGMFLVGLLARSEVVDLGTRGWC
jgi:hypothetical protein